MNNFITKISTKYDIMIELPDTTWPLGIWSECKGTYSRGYAMSVDGEIKDGFDLSKYFCTGSELEFKNLLEEADGCFAVVVDSGHYCFAAVDRSCTTPLFYGFTSDKKLILSERAETVRQAVGNSEITPEAENLFLFAGLVLDSKTLLSNVYQLQAGQYLVFDSTNMSFKVKNYHTFGKPGELDLSEEQLYTNLDEIYLKTFKKLASWLGGRKALVPLSGGYDSRLITLMLKQVGYDNVCCFSYNYAQRDWELDISRKVAGYLGFEWIPVKCTPKLYRKHMQKGISRQKIIDIINWSSWPVIQEWAPLHQIYRDLGRPNAVVISGHGGYLVGGNIPEKLFKGPFINSTELIDMLYSFYGSRDIDRNGAGGKIFREMLANKSAEEYTSSAAIHFWQRFYRLERSAKILGRGFMLAPDALNIPVAMPLLNRDAMNLWSRVSPHYLEGKAAYKRYIERIEPALPQGNKYNLNNAKKIHKLRNFKLQWAKFTLLNKFILLIAMKGNLKKYFRVALKAGFRIVCLRTLKSNI